MSSSVLIIDVPQLILSIVFTSLISLTTIYGYNYYQSYQRKQTFKNMCSYFWSFFNTSATLGARVKQVGILEDIHRVATLISQDLHNDLSSKSPDKINIANNIGTLLKDPVILSNIENMVNNLLKGPANEAS